MQITEITIRLATHDLVKGYVDIVFDNCFMIEGIRIVKGPPDFSSHFLPRSKETGAIGTLLSGERRDANDDPTVILAEYEKWIRDISE